MSQSRFPTREDIKSLPQLAAAAFVARCARRVQPVFESGPLKPSAMAVSVVDDAIRFTERAAIHGLMNEPSGQLEEKVQVTFGDLDSARAHRLLSQYVLDAPGAALLALQAVRGSEISVDAARLAVIRATDALSALASVEASDMAAAIRADYELLLQVSRAEHWTDRTPVPPEFFGPMWPNGAPEGWPTEAASARPPLAVKVEIQTPSGMDKHASEVFNRRVAQLFAEMSALHVAMGGNGLRILDDASAAPVPDEDELPVGVDKDECVQTGGHR